MKISVIGCGYLGAVHAAAMAELGHDVIGIDVDDAKIAALAAGRAPFFEPGLPEIITSAESSGRLRFSTHSRMRAGAKVHFIAVGTPQKKGEDAADLSYVNAAIDGLLPYLPRAIWSREVNGAGGHGRSLAGCGSEAAGAMLAWNPEFLREGFAVNDTIAPGPAGLRRRPAAGVRAPAGCIRRSRRSTRSMRRRSPPARL